jgi:lipoyl-dependent peroxiredoxin
LIVGIRGLITVVYRFSYTAFHTWRRNNGPFREQGFIMTIESIDKVLYTAKVHTTGGRDGASRSSDGRLDITLSTPGSTRIGTNPEQLLAAGWPACFEGAMGIAARKMKIALPPDLAIDAEVDLGMTGEAYMIRARLYVSLPGVDRDVAQALVDAAHRTCPYSKATRGNIDVVIHLV